MKRYWIAQVGLQSRGRTHVEGFLSNAERFHLVAFCDLDEERLRRGVADYGISAAYTDADKMLAETKPEVFCCVTQPHVRLELVDWLDDKDQVHPCNVEVAYHSQEILEGIWLSALDNVRVDLPLQDPGASDDILERMRKALSMQGGAI